MTLDQPTIAQLAAHLDSAAMERRAVTKITDDYPDMDWEDAYAVQYAMRECKAARGIGVAGLKMGLTSRAKMKQMEVDVPCFGFLTDDRAYGDGAEIPIAEFIHPRVEAEIALVTHSDLHGPGCHIGDVLRATDFLLPAVEIIDSRYENFRFDLKSVIADNTSAAAFVAGGRSVGAEDVDLRSIGLVLEKNGEIVEVGAGAAVLGHPASSVAMLANMLADRDEHIPAGTFIMTGGITAAVAVEAGDNINVRYQALGSLGMRFV